MDILMVKVKPTKLLPASSQGVKILCSTPSQLQKFDAEANQNGRLFKGKELDKEKMEAQPGVHKALVQE